MGRALLLFGLVPALAGCRGAPAPKPAEEAAPARAEGRYVGVEVCEECHPTAWRDWATTRHARATVTLQTGMAMMVAQRVGVEPEGLPDNRVCLECHGTGVRDGKDLDHAPSSRPEEGVTCEACHGPAGAHVAAAREGREGPALTGSLWRPVRECGGCHGPRASHEHERSVPYDEANFHEQIEHGKEPSGQAGAAR